MYSSNNIDYDNTFDLDEIRRAIQALFGPDDIVEFRVLKAKRDGKRYGTVSGYFDGKHRDVLAKTAEHWSGHVPGVYVTLNPVLPDLLARSKNQVTNWAEHTTKDAEVSRRVWLLIDFDAKRPPGISASDAEHEAALDRARECKQWLSEKGWPRPIYADSGNGGHLLYRIDLPNDPEVTQLVKGCLDTIAVKWSDETVDVDRSVYNSARIIKLYGTLAAKGDETPDRPHRISKMLEVPDRVEAVPRKLLAAMLTTPMSSDDGMTDSMFDSLTGGPNGNFSLRQWIAEHDLPVVLEKPWNGGRMWVLNPCPWNPEHTNESAFVGHHANGAVFAGCHHDGCQGKGWHELRDVCEPGWRTRQTTRERKPSQTDQLIALSGECELFHTAAGETYVTMQENGHRETWPVDSKHYRQWLLKRFYGLRRGAPRRDALESAIGSIGAQARFGGNQREVYVRTAEHDGSIYVDLCNDAWEVVKIDSSGWQIVSDPPVRFRRSNGMLPLPNPERNGSVNSLRGFINVDDRDWPLVVAWLIAALQPQGPYPILLLCAEQGAGKSTTARLLRALVDPNSAALRAEPRNEHELMIAARNAWCLTFDNLSKVSQSLSDGLCRLSTGGGFAVRQLYTDSDEVIYDAQRPIAITSIADIATRSDLLDRCLIVYLPPISSERRLTESDYWREFEAASPGIFGALLEAVSVAIRNLPTTNLNDLPRLADFAKWATAAEEALGLRSGGFMEAYLANRESANDLVLDTSPVAKALFELLDGRDGEWEGTAAELLAALQPLADQGLDRQYTWPKTAQYLSSTLRRLAPNLRKAGYHVEQFQTPGGNSRKMWRLRRPDRRNADAA